MYSPQIIRLLDVADVNSISNAEGVVPRTLRIKGKDMRSVETVLIHGFESPQTILLSDTEVLAQVPDNLAEMMIYDVTVLSANFTLTERSLVEFNIGKSVKKVRGILRLLQVFVRLLLRTPGSNIFHPNTGGGVAAVIGRNIEGHEASDVAVGIRRVEQDIISRQAPIREIPADERLLAAKMSGFYFDQQTGSMYVTVTLTTHSGRTAAATIAT